MADYQVVNARDVAVAPAISAISAVSVDIVIPVYNEQEALPGCITVLCAYLDAWFPFDWTVTIVDNASTDKTRDVALALARRRPRVRAVFLDRRGKGYAVRTAWQASRAEIVAYMDVDLSTGLDALLPMVTSLASGHSDIAIGSRLVPGARNVRGPRREVISRGYNTLLRLVHGVPFRDAQCGFKAARSGSIRPLLGHVRDDSWFFDTELLLLAEHNGLRVHEVPVDWVEDVDSRVRVASTAAGNLRGLLRLALVKARGGARVAGLPVRPAPRAIHPDAVVAPAPSRSRRLLSVVAAGAAAVLAGLAGYALLRTWWPPSAANLVATGLTAWVNSATAWLVVLFGAAGTGAHRHLHGAVAFGLSYAATSGALLALDAAVRRSSRLLELAVLLAVSTAGTAGRLAGFARIAGRGVPPQRRGGVR